MLNLNRFMVNHLAKIYLNLFGYPDVGTHIYFPYVLRLLKPRPGEKILDAGCGNGIYLNSLIRKFAIKGWGVDINDLYLKRAKAIAKIFKVSGQFKKMNLTNLLFPDGFFDKIICLQVLQFIDDDERAIREMGRVLKKGGILVLGFPGEKYYNLSGHNSKKLSTMRIQRRGYSLEKLTELVKNTGFKILKKKIVSGRFFKRLVLIQSWLYLKDLELLNLLIFPLVGWLAKVDLKFGKANKNEAIYLWQLKKYESKTAIL